MTEVTDVECPATASMILEESIKDIECGGWTCNSLTKPVKYALDAKPRGCAVGLVGINGGAAKFRRLVDRLDARFEYPDPSAGWPLKARQAIILLAQALPKPPDDVEEFNPESQLHLDICTEYIIEYNDSGKQVRDPEGEHYGGNIDRSEALKWFKRAHALALEQRI